MYKILILAYLIGQSPIETQQTFQMEIKYDYHTLIYGSGTPALRT